MFHTFETTQYASPEQHEASGSSSKRRTSTVRACEPCRRRKIRCNGEHPCETCQWYRKANTCHYTEPRQRQMPSKRSVEKISMTLQEYRAILQQLFPSTHPDMLQGLSRDKLVEMISKNSPFVEPPSPITPGMDEKPPCVSPDAGSLEALQTMPEDAVDGLDSHTKGNGLADDVNALSLSVKPSSSYLGISSVMAVLRVIIWLDPESQSFFARTPDRSTGASRRHSLPPEENVPGATLRPDVSSASSAWDEIPLINAYFTYVHTFVPLIEEQRFRDTYMTAKRSDRRWLLLLNSVLAMGSVAASTSDDVGHRVYYNRAKQFLDLECFGSANLETVQALALLGGFYLHYVQEPTLANAIMGAAFRLATTIGLHREYLDGITPANPKNMAYSTEIRRRVWWCLFILDAWASGTLGRPSMGRMGHAITAKPPQEPIGRSAFLHPLLQENIRFSVISTRMEDALATSPIIPERELANLDNSFVEWYRTSIVSATTPRTTAGEPFGVTVTKNVMRWRYLSSRIVLVRPVLLWYALRRMPFSALPPEKKEAIHRCRELTNELIHDIVTTWRAQKPAQMSGWNSTWMLYQTVMVSLLSLYTDPNDPEVVQSSRQQVETAMMGLAEMRGWSFTAHRSLEVVGRIYEVSKRLTMSQVGQQSVESHMLVDADRRRVPDNVFARVPGLTEPSMTVGNQELFMDNMFDSLNWSTGFDDHDFPLATPAIAFDLEAMNGWGLPQGFDSYADPTVFDTGPHEFAVDQNSTPSGSNFQPGPGPEHDQRQFVYRRQS